MDEMLSSTAEVQMNEMRRKCEQVTAENKRLHAELKEALEVQLNALPFKPLGAAIPADEEISRNLQEQLQLANQDQLANFNRLTTQLHAANEKTELSNQFLKTVSEQNAELEQLQEQLSHFDKVDKGLIFPCNNRSVIHSLFSLHRQAKIDRRTASAKVDEMIRLTKTLQGQLERKEEDVVSAQQREASSDKLLQQMQSSIKQLETRLRVTVQDAEELRTERTALEKQIRTLQTKCANLDREKYEAVAKVQDCLQLLEEANLQKSQALFKKKQKDEEIKKMKDEIFQLAEDTAARIRKAVESAKKQYNAQISQLTEELLALHMECGEKQSQIERAIREKRAVEEELEKISAMEHEYAVKEHGFEVRLKEMEDVSQKSTAELRHLLVAQQKATNRWKEETKVLTETTEARISKLKSDLSQQKLRNQELIAQLETANNKVME
ncbi:hypothetical protein ASZ78_010763, partial [Callipepla squamata]